MTIPPLPDQGMTPTDILAALTELRSVDLDFTKATSYHFDSGEEQVREVCTPPTKRASSTATSSRRTSFSSSVRDRRTT